jgi:hypothetical protein
MAGLLLDLPRKPGRIPARSSRDIVEVELPENSRSGFLRLSLTIADATEAP